MLSLMPMSLILFSASLCQFVYLIGLLSLSLSNAQGSVGHSPAAAPAVSAAPPSPPLRSASISIWYWLAIIIIAVLTLNYLTLPLPLHAFPFSVDSPLSGSFLSPVLKVTVRPKCRGLLVQHDDVLPS